VDDHIEAAAEGKSKEIAVDSVHGGSRNAQ
jgi:hypothetical protein